ncbi:hypothetical protein H4Q32_002637 [Labeo rohita]|uniref:LysM and peptidoglycan-binding domain-containing 3 n=1 Tax=Labeo rohita TaxID=84645 RepID=A0ABQ8MNL0_LABRO|nr:hypothetical protein H4Q32_002637 [Labeo rohita]
MTGRNQHNGFQFATTVQPPTGGYMSVFGNNSETDYSEEDGEAFELRSRGRERHRRSTSTDRKDDIIYLIRDIKDGDTLISISLQYFCTSDPDWLTLPSAALHWPCSRQKLKNSQLLPRATPVKRRRRIHNSFRQRLTSPIQSQWEALTLTPRVNTPLVADIKRANNLLTEQDFFALRSIRIPNLGDPRFWSFLGLFILFLLCGQRGVLPSGKDKDIQLLVKSSAPSRSSLSEVVSSLEQPLLGDPDRRPAQKKDPYYGADWGMRWWTAVAIMLVVGIVTPVFYLLYYEVLMKADVSHHTTIDSIRPGPTQPAVPKIGLPPPSAASHQDSHLQAAAKQQHFANHEEKA